MNLKKVLLSSAAALALTSGAAFAASGTATVAQDQTGDYLVFPAYYANSSGWSTNVKVVNTNTTHAVVAKVVIREYVTSAEKLDFPIYLTPGDVFEMTLENVGGTVYVKSTDDSMFSGGNPASTTNAVNQALFAATGSQNNTMGYVEVFGIAQVAATDVASGWTENTPLSKSALYTKFNDELNGSGGSTVSSNDWTGVNADALYGQEVISAANSNGNLAMTLMATALENVTGANEVSGLVISTDTTLANNVGSDVDDVAKLAEIENALQKSNVYVTYYDAASGSAAETALLLNQPMKKYRFALESVPAKAESLDTVLGYDYASDDVSGYLPTEYSFNYSAVARDQQENANITNPEYSGGTTTSHSCNTEICTIDLATFIGTYTKGYVDFAIGMPVIPAVMTAKSVGSTNVTNIVYPAYK